jgi:hypothetical protein
LQVVNSPRFVDLPPIQIFAQLLDEGVYLCSISTMYRVLAANQQVRERRRLARHPARVRPELVATAPGQVFSWDITRWAGQGQVLRRLRDDRHLLPLHRRRRGPCPRVGPVGGGDDEGDLRHPWGPAGHPRRPWHVDDVQDRRGVAVRPGGHQVTFTPESLQ